MNDSDAHARRRAAARRAARRRRRTAVAALLAVTAAGVGVVAMIASGWGSGHAVPAPASSRRPAPPAAPPASTGPPLAAPARGLTIAAVGDTMLGSTPTLPPDPGGYLAPVRAALRAGIAFGNLEGTLTDRTAGKCAAGSTSCFAFRAPPEFAYALRAAGFDVLSNANNHSYDFGPGGQADTVAALHGAGIAQTGLPGEITVLRRHGLRVAFVAFAPYPDTASLLDLAGARRLVVLAARRADIVVCAMHAGAEGVAAEHLTGSEETYVGEDRGDPERFARAAVDAGADLVLGSGPHVLRGMEIYRGRLIAYSLGNFAGYHNFALDGDLAESVVLRVRLGEDGAFEGGRLVSVRLVDAGRPVVDPSSAGARLVRTLSRTDLPGGIRVDPDGVLRPPV